MPNTEPTMDVPSELLDSTISLPVQELLLASTNHDIPTIRTLLKSDAHLVNSQDPDTGITPLHAAIAACEDDDDQPHEPRETQETQPISAHANGDGARGEAPAPHLGSASTVEKCKATVEWLLQHGAIWNALDANGETPGCVAHRLGLRDVYAVLVDAGTRAEMLLNRLEEYEQLADDEDDEDDEGNDNENDNNENTEHSTEEDQPKTEPPSHNNEAEVAENNQAFLKSDLTFQPSALLDRDANGVMMSWETDIMAKIADLLLPTPKLRVLNIGHGMGIIDGLFQAKQPSSHHIVEAHPDVLAEMRRRGWQEKPGVQVHEGRWQDVVPKLVEAGEQFDAVFFDTFAEDYAAFKTLFDEHIIGLLSDNGKWSFFNGLGADRQISYDVYRNILSMDLQECGYEVAWTEMDVPDLQDEGTWDGTKRPYWTLKKYQLPICSFFS